MGKVENTTTSLQSLTMSLSYQIERLSNTLRQIKQQAELIISSPVPKPDYAALVLHTPLTEVIQDIDTSELGLFILVSDPKDASQKVSRTEFHGATPLKKQARSKSNVHESEREVEPEVYAKAALRYIDR